MQVEGQVYGPCIFKCSICMFGVCHVNHYVLLSPIADIHCFNCWLGGVAWGLCLGNSAEPGLLKALPWVAKQTHTLQQYYRVLCTLHPSSPMVTSSIAVIPYQGQAIDLETILLTRMQILLRSIIHMCVHVRVHICTPTHMFIQS